MAYETPWLKPTREVIPIWLKDNTAEIIKDFSTYDLSVSISDAGKITVYAPMDMEVQYIKDNLIKMTYLLNLGWKPYYTSKELSLLKEKAYKLISERVAYYAPIVGVDYGNIIINRISKKFIGRCYGNGDLWFHLYLIFAPLKTIDSVVVHELCHRKEHNHSKAFWNEVYKVIPEDELNIADEWLGYYWDVLLVKGRK